ncbi:MAG: SPW repeat protein [Trueperaceae bacterium]
MIPTNVHGVIDYIVGPALIAAPWLFGFADGGAETWVPVLLGAGIILYSLVTDYELSMSKSLSMSAHLGIDIAGGAFLAVSPWLLGYSDLVYWPHLVVGLAIIIISLMTKTVPEYKRVVRR